ncbi:MAG: hypothetical protein PHU24_09925 [Sphaerochaetaceae bacterium]|jgi:cytochrome b561|nr:hypothetical protein [Sphaerochaetaceae bacterium]NLO59991.1 hypothetical protein [Spirochaetales bacterium]MDD2406759.1 hypothetical protein [Sphaerochaetaceae bacterium]MDD3671456.1 hypothetical protein [Sphaerochaetaceae bacterium]MDD4258749.1 hypothetical protein [Sphaerochaetaceae bacterium]
MEFLQQIAYHYFFGFPVIGYLGIISYLLMWATALVMILTRRKIVKIKPKVHFRLAYSTAIIATIHGVLAVAVYL